MKKGFSKLIVFLIIIIIIVIGIMGLYEAEVIRTYKITNFDIEAVINKDGSMTVKEITDYRFNGRYNGITITIPDGISEDQYDKMTENSINDSKLKDSLYNNSGLEDISIYIIEDDKIRQFNQVGSANLGDNSVYTVSNDDGYTTYKIYEPSKNENKKFVIEYTLKDAAVLHNDVGEIWWNFIGGGTDCKISNLNINILTLSGAILEGYIHSNESGKINYIENNKLSATVKSVMKNEFVGVRLVFPKQNISESSKISNEDALDIIHSQEKSYSDKSNTRKILNIISIIITSCILLYWIYLLLRYEKEIIYTPVVSDDFKILEKYNPMIAACIAQNRDMHPRDILALLVDMTNRKILEIKTIKSIDPKNDKEKITYRLTKNKEFFSKVENIQTLDDIERSVLNIFFSGENKIDLEAQLKKIKRDNKAAKKVKLLDEIVIDKLDEIGANFVKVPKWLLVVNNFIFVACMIYIFCVITFNIILGLSTMSTTTEQIKEVTKIVLSIFGFILVSSLPLVMYLILLVLKIINFVRKKFVKLSFKLTSKKIIQSIIQIALLFVIIFILESVFLRHSYIIICTVLFMMALLLILTDNLMSSHSLRIRNDFFYLKSIQDKIENGSLLDEKKIEDRILWDKYLAFAIALGVGDVANLVKNIPSFDYFESCIDKFENIYDVYYLSRNDLSNSKLVKFENIIYNILESSSSDGYSGGSSFGSGFSGGSSSFGGGGFSGGGRWRWTEEVRFRKIISKMLTNSKKWSNVYMYFSKGDKLCQVMTYMN